jgi:hypothetical protein
MTASFSRTEPPPGTAESDSGHSWRDVAALALLVVGLAQMTGDLLGLRWLRGLGAATVASPLPKVFSDVAGLETFASRFELEVVTPRGTSRRDIDPALYARLGGPYNRRNVYGAALSYAPRLPTKLWEQVFCYGFAPAGPLRRELGVAVDATAVRVHIATRTRGRSDRWILEPHCAP